MIDILVTGHPGVFSSLADELKFSDIQARELFFSHAEELAEYQPDSDTKCVLVSNNEYHSESEVAELLSRLDEDIAVVLVLYSGMDCIRRNTRVVDYTISLSELSEIAISLAD